MGKYNEFLYNKASIILQREKDSIFIKIFT